MGDGWAGRVGKAVRRGAVAAFRVFQNATWMALLKDAQ